MGRLFLKIALKKLSKWAKKGQKKLKMEQKNQAKISPVFSSKKIKVKKSALQIGAKNEPKNEPKCKFPF